MNKIDCLIGKIASAFVRIEFLVSNIAYEIKHTDSPYKFFAKSNAEKKIKKLKEFILDSHNQIQNSKELAECLDEIDFLRKERNKIVHSIILKNISDDDDLRTYNYRLDNKIIISEFGSYKTSDLEDLIEKFINAHNKIYKTYYRE